MSSRVKPKNQAIRALPSPEPRPLTPRALTLAQSAWQAWNNTINGIAAGMDLDLATYNIDVQGWRFVPIQRPSPVPETTEEPKEAAE